MIISHNEEPLRSMTQAIADIDDLEKTNQCDR